MSSIFLQEIKLVPSNLIERDGNQITVISGISVYLQSIEKRIYLIENEPGYFEDMDEEEKEEFNSPYFTHNSISISECKGFLVQPVIYPCEYTGDKAKLFAANTCIQRVGTLFKVIDILSKNKSGISYYRNFLVSQLENFIIKIDDIPFKLIETEDDLKSIMEDGLSDFNNGVIAFKNFNYEISYTPLLSDFESVEINKLKELIHFWDYLGILQFLQDTWKLNEKHNGLVDFFENKTKAADVLFSLIAPGKFSNQKSRDSLRKYANDILAHRSRYPDYLADYKKLENSNHKAILKLFTDLGLKPKKKD